LLRLNHVRLANASVALCALLAFATLCATFAGTWWLFELFVHFRVQYVVAGLLLALALLLMRRRGWALVALALACINSPDVVRGIAGGYVTHAQQAASAAPPVRVVSFNVFGRNREHERVVEYLRQQKADVIVLLEITPAWGQALEPLRDEFAYFWVIPTGERAGMAVLSRTQPLRTQEIDLGSTGEPSLLLTVASGNKPAPGSELTILGTHLYWPLGASHAEVRNRQMQSVARVARAHTGPLIVAGDFNITPFSPHFKQLLSDADLRDCAARRGLTATWPVRFAPLFIHIDHCLASREVIVDSFTVGPYLGSDHYPIIFDVRMAVPTTGR